MFQHVPINFLGSVIMPKNIDRKLGQVSTPPSTPLGARLVMRLIYAQRSLIKYHIRITPFLFRLNY